MRPSPPEWPRMSAELFYDDPRAALAWLTEAFGLTVRRTMDGPDGALVHSELVLADAVVMVSGAVGGRRSPRPGGPTAALVFYVDDVDGHHARAVGAGATIVSPLQTIDMGAGFWVDRMYGCVDPEGHPWWFAERIETR